jgi:copper chaperone CopZ
MCEASCVKSVRDALRNNIVGIDVIGSDVQNKTIQAQYDLQYLRKTFGVTPVSVNTQEQSISISIKDLLARISSTVEDVGHEKPTLQSAKVISDDASIAQSENTQENKNVRIKGKQGPLFSEVLMQHPVMKGLQATTMVLMVPMIPIMLSAVYVVISRAIKHDAPMPGM